jgi:bifunctional non-homologous end joining protein LigD
VALFAAVRERGLEGIVAKAADSPYRPGPSPLWRKVKVRRRLRCAVVGYTLRDGLLRSLLLGAHAGGRLAYVGAVSAGLSDALRRAFHGTLATLPPLQPLTREPAPPGAERRWVRPALAVEVEFAEFTADGRLRHPVLLGLVPDPPEACRLPPEALPAAAARRRE